MRAGEGRSAIRQTISNKAQKDNMKQKPHWQDNLRGYKDPTFESIITSDVKSQTTNGTDRTDI